MSVYLGPYHSFPQREDPVIIRGKQLADGWIDFMVTKRDEDDVTVAFAVQLNWLTGWTGTGSMAECGRKGVTRLVMLVRVILVIAITGQVISGMSWLRHDVDCVGIDGVERRRGRRRRVEVEVEVEKESSSPKQGTTRIRCINLCMYQSRYLSGNRWRDRFQDTYPYRIVPYLRRVVSCRYHHHHLPKAVERQHCDQGNHAFRIGLSYLDLLVPFFSVILVLVDLGYTLYVI